MYYLFSNIEYLTEAISLQSAADIRLTARNFLLSASPYLVVGVIVFITLLIVWRQIRQLKNGSGSCCSRSDLTATDKNSNTDHPLEKTSSPGCSGCSYAGRCQDNRLPGRKENQND